MIGKTLDHYRIVKRIGAGGMGEVYRARDEQLHRDVAIKLLPASSLGDPAARDRLLREARSAAALNHPHICTIHQVGDTGGHAYIAMELVEGEPLSARILRGALPQSEVVRYGRQLAEALAHAHGRGVVHRDLKSANVVVSPDGRAKVLDFGLAKRRPQAELDDVTHSQVTLEEQGAITGTLAYMAPEVLRGQPADARCDLWALGVMLYEMAAGTLPFRGQTGYELTSAILQVAPPPLPEEISAELGTIITRCLEKNPAQRYQRAAEVCAALDIAASSASPVPQLRPKKAAPRKRAGRKRIRSLVVLPLANLSRDPEQEYFADGMTEALISDLAKLGSLKVISRTSAMRFKATDKSLPEIAAEVDVDAVVEGSVLRVGQQVRITAQLIHAASDTHLWAESYDRDLKDVLFLQSEVARAIARAIQATVTPEDAQRLAGARPVNPEAYEAYLKGRFHWLKLSPKHLDTALAYFQLALEKDPDYALAHVGIGYVWFSRADTGVMPPQEALPKGREAALKAAASGDMLSEVHELLAAVRYIADRDWATGEKEFRRAIQLNPNVAETRLFYAHYLLIQGREREWEPEIRRALELDPLNFFTQCFFGWHLVYLGRYDEAVSQLRRVLRTEANYPAAHLGLWGAYYKQRMYPEALSEAREFFTALSDNEIAGALTSGSNEEQYRAAMRAAAEKLVERSSQSYVPALRIARLLAHAGEKERALECLERACDHNEPPLVHLNVAWDWDTLRDEPRFRRLLQRINFPGSDKET